MSRIKTAAGNRSNVFQAAQPVQPSIVVAVSAAHAESAAMVAGCTSIRVVADTNCHIRISAAGTAATANDMYLPKDRVEHFLVTPADIISVIRDTADGHLFINQLTNA